MRPQTMTLPEQLPHPLRRPRVLPPTLVAAVVALVCVVASPSAPASSSVDAAAVAAAAVTKPSGSFLTAELPGEVERRSGVRDTVVGDIEHHTASCTAGDAKLSITASTLPGFITAVTTDDMLYRKARNELLKNFSAKRRSWSRCTHAGHECRALLYGTGDGRKGMARLYLRDDVLVVTNAVYDQDEPIARRFLDSAH